MSPPAPPTGLPPRFVAPGTVVAIVATSVPGIFQGMSIDSPLARLVVGVLGLVVLAVATAGVGWAEREPVSRKLNLVLAAYGALVVGLLLASEGRAFLVTMPFLSMLVLYLPLRRALLFTAALTVVEVSSFSPFISSWLDVARVLAQCLSAAAFVVAFSLIARKERYARAEIERLSGQVAELAATRERNRLARELHDSLGHALTAAHMQLEALRAVRDDPRLVTTQQLLKNGLTELRSAVSMLREERRPLAEALSQLVAECNAAGQVVELTTVGPARPVPPEVGFTLFRAAQEALTNVRRHAQAGRAEVKVSWEQQGVKLAVVDDGVGPSSAGVAGHGLSGLRERVTELGGTLVVDGPSSGGYRLQVEVPT
jgi:signal transduction histidine kinase